ncbi:MAG: DUF257 family protein [Palaeococcus sp.]|nr:DUF257 family protein [Palaeococcus sp. (in: euryarchaeotes)]
MKAVEVGELVKYLKPGETVLIKYDSKNMPAYVLHYLMEQAKEKNMPVLVDDYLDTLYLYKTHLELSGYDTTSIESVKVIKVGGIKEVGRIVEKIPLSTGPALKENYRKAYQKAKIEGKTLLNPVIGLEKFFVISDSKIDMLSEIEDIALYVGDKTRIALYFLNEDVLKGTKFNPLPLLESLATTLIAAKRDERGCLLTVVKSINPEIEGKMFRT